MTVACGEKEINERAIWPVVTAYCILMYTRSPKRLSAFQKLLTVTAVKGHADDSVSSHTFIHDGFSQELIGWRGGGSNFALDIELNPDKNLGTIIDFQKKKVCLPPWILFIWMSQNSMCNLVKGLPLFRREGLEDPVTKNLGAKKYIFHLFFC